jgi:hypothetical protein
MRVQQVGHTHRLDDSEQRGQRQTDPQPAPHLRQPGSPRVLSTALHGHPRQQQKQGRHPQGRGYADGFDPVVGT